MAARGMAGGPAPATRMVLTRSKANSRAKAGPFGGDASGDDVHPVAGGAEDGGEAAEETTTVCSVRESLSERAASLRLRASNPPATGSATVAGSDVQMSPSVLAALGSTQLVCSSHSPPPQMLRRSPRCAPAPSRPAVEEDSSEELGLDEDIEGDEIVDNARKKRRRRGSFGVPKRTSKATQAAVRAAQQLRKRLANAPFGTNIIGRIMDVRYTLPLATYRVQVTGFDGANGWHTVDSAGLGTPWLGDDFTDLIDVNKMYADSQITFLDKTSLTAIEAPLPPGYSPSGPPGFHPATASGGGDGALARRARQQTTPRRAAVSSLQQLVPHMEAIPAAARPSSSSSSSFGPELVGSVLDITYTEPPPVQTYRCRVTKFMPTKKWHSVTSIGPAWEGHAFTDVVDVAAMHAEGCIAFVGEAASASPALAGTRRLGRPPKSKAKPTGAARAPSKPLGREKPSEPLSLRDGRIVLRFGNDVVGRIADLSYTNPARKVRVCVTGYDPGTECHAVDSVGLARGFQDEVHLSAMFAAGKAAFVDQDEEEEEAEEKEEAAALRALGIGARRGRPTLAKPYVDQAKAKTRSAKAKKKVVPPLLQTRMHLVPKMVKRGGGAR